MQNGQKWHSMQPCRATLHDYLCGFALLGKWGWMESGHLTPVTLNTDPAKRSFSARTRFPARQITYNSSMCSPPKQHEVIIDVGNVTFCISCPEKYGQLKETVSIGKQYMLLYF